METRRHKDIVAFRWGQGAPLAFHAKNMEVAEISNELWDSLRGDSSSDPHLLADIEAWNNEISTDVILGKLDFGIRSLTINVNQICNLKCSYCAAGGDGSFGAPQTKINVEKTLPQLKYFLDKVPSGGRFRITFLGGEPLLYPEGIKELSNYVKSETKERGLIAEFSIVTNGTLIDEDITNLLASIQAQVTVSIDGPAAINDLVRPTKNGLSSTAQTLNGIRLLKGIKNKLRGPLTVHGVFSKDNLDIVAAYNFYRELDVDRFEFTLAVEDHSEELSRKFVEQMNIIAETAYRVGGEKALRKIGVFDQYFESLDSQLQLENHCGAGKSYLMVDAKNNLFTCPWDVGNLKEQVGTGSQLDNNRLEPFQEPLISKNDCRSCWARHLCGGGCMHIHKQGTGSKNVVNKYFCFKTQSLIATSILFYKLSRESC